MSLLMTAPGSLAHRKILAAISSKSRTSQVMLSTFTTKFALLKIVHSEAY